MNLYIGLIFEFEGKKLEIVKMDFYEIIIICVEVNFTEVQLYDFTREEVLELIGED